MDLNKVQIIGNITQDIELKQTPNWQSVCSLSVATNRNWKDANGMRQEQAEFHNLVFWGKLAEIAGEYLQKWKKVYVEGRLQTRNWEAQDGTKRYRTEIVWENMIMLSWAPWELSGGENNMSPPIKNINSNPTPAKSSKAPKAEEEISIEDIPF